MHGRGGDSGLTHGNADLIERRQNVAGRVEPIDAESEQCIFIMPSLRQIFLHTSAY